MNETYKLPFTAEEIEDKLTNGCGLELVGTFALNLNEDYDPFDECFDDCDMLYTIMDNDVKVIQVKLGSYERACVTWCINDNVGFDYECSKFDLCFNTYGFKVSAEIWKAARAGSGTIIFKLYK